MTEDEFYTNMSRFLAEKWEESTGEALTRPIAPNDNLFDLGLVDSFTMIRMIVHVEGLTGHPIDLADHDLETFYTLRGLYTATVKPAATR